MSVHHLSSDLDTEEPPLARGRGVLWIAAAIAALVIGGSAAAMLVLAQSDNIANHWIAAGPPAPGFRGS